MYVLLNSFKREFTSNKYETIQVSNKIKFGIFIYIFLFLSVEKYKIKQIKHFKIQINSFKIYIIY